MGRKAYWLVGRGLSGGGCKEWGGGGGWVGRLDGGLDLDNIYIHSWFSARDKHLV